MKMVDLNGRRISRRRMLAMLPPERAGRVTVRSNAPLTRGELRRIRKGFDVDLMPEGGMDVLKGVSSEIRGLNVTAHERRDLSMLREMTGLRRLSVQGDRFGPAVDLSALPTLESVSLQTSASWKCAGSAISAPRVTSIGIWRPETHLFESFPTSATDLRLVYSGKMAMLPPLSAPELVRSLWYQVVPSLDLSEVTRFSSLQSLSIESVRGQITGFSALGELASLRSLSLGNVAEVDDPSALGNFDLDSFTEWNEKSQESRIWWASDLRALRDRGVTVADDVWLQQRDDFERRWMRRTGLTAPKHF